MGMTLRVAVLLSATLFCHGVSIQEQLEHIAQRRQENAGLGRFRRVFGVDDTSSILGAPRYPNHLPEAEAILPAHTLLRPTLGMLKSAIKFPHREMESGAGVYGNTNNILGIKWDGTNQRLAYSGFRRSPSDFMEVIPGRAMASEEDVLEAKEHEPLFGIVAWLPSHPYHKVGSHSSVVPIKREANVAHNYQKSNPVSEENEWESEKSKIKEHIYGYKSNGLTGQMGEETPTRHLKSRLYTSPETLKFVKLMLQKLKEVKRRRRQGDIVVLKPTDGEHGSEDLGYGFNAQDQEYDDDELNIGTTESAKNVSVKSKWFWDSKNAFNHIKFNSDAPDHEEHLPANAKDFEDDPKKWWYFHQSDFQPFTDPET